MSSASTTSRAGVLSIGPSQHKHDHISTREAKHALQPAHLMQWYAIGLLPHVLKRCTAAAQLQIAFRTGMQNARLTCGTSPTTLGIMPGHCMGYGIGLAWHSSTRHQSNHTCSGQHMGCLHGSEQQAQTKTLAAVNHCEQCRSKSHAQSNTRA